ncbi:hypothetical protein [Streptomyces sp. 1222.5]|uniref:hypothetical protein n=1 Tax=Streptomyces sp. 1222.5 TaxID=1881026 RepID=UPI003EBF1FF0
MSTVSIDLPPYAKAVFKAGRPIVLLTALIMSIPGEIHLAEVAGWSRFSFFGFSFNVSTLMPVCVSVYAACSAVIADVAKRLKLPNRRSALAGAVAALGLALAAQDMSHLIEQDYMHSSWVLVALVSAIPPIVAFHMLHMAATPESTASVVEVEELEDNEDQDVTKRPRKRKPGRPGLDPAEVEEAIEKLNAAGKKVTPENLGSVLNRSARTARRYLSEVRKAEDAATSAAGQMAGQTAGTLQLTI